jgi:DNA-binding GntR family transcriptional regulator
MSRKNQVYEYLLEAILSNKLPAGSAIAELDISNEMAVSRTPIREALKELEAEGLVTRYPSRGTIVSPITPYDVEEIFSLRILLEVYALRLSMKKITVEEIARVEKMFLELDSTSSKDEYRKADKSLHALIIDRSGNRRLKQFLIILNSQIERFRRLAASEPTRLANSKVEHLEILALLKQQDLNACEAALKKHLTNVKNSTLEVAKLSAMTD